MNDQKLLTQREYFQFCLEIQDRIAGAYSAFSHSGDPVLSMLRLRKTRERINQLIDRLEQIPAFTPQPEQPTKKQ
jgi:hypothetical protein